MYVKKSVSVILEFLEETMCDITDRNIASISGIKKLMSCLPLYMFHACVIAALLFVGPTCRIKATLVKIYLYLFC